MTICADTGILTLCSVFMRAEYYHINELAAIEYVKTLLSPAGGEWSNTTVGDAIPADKKKVRAHDVTRTQQSSMQRVVSVGSED